MLEAALGEGKDGGSNQLCAIIKKKTTVKIPYLTAYNNVEIVKLLQSLAPENDE